jgi:hypothetical protein
MLKAVALNHGRFCWRKEYRVGLTPDCEGHLYPVALVVPSPRRARKIKIERVPLSEKTSPAKPARGRRKGKSTARGPLPKPPPRPAKAGDRVMLLACPIHGQRVWVKVSYVTDWRCGFRVGTDDECGVPGQQLTVATLTRRAGAVVPVPQ